MSLLVTLFYVLVVLVIALLFLRFMLFTTVTSIGLLALILTGNDSAVTKDVIMWAIIIACCLDGAVLLNGGVRITK